MRFRCVEQRGDVVLVFGGGQSTSASTVDYKSRLLAFYQKHNPSKVDTVDSTLEKYKGKEKLVLRVEIQGFHPQG